MEAPKLSVSTITAKISARKIEILENCGPKAECSVYSVNIEGFLPFGIQFKDVVSIMAFIGAGQTNPSRLCIIWSASVAGKHRLSLHITLQSNNTRGINTQHQFTKYY